MPQRHPDPATIHGECQRLTGMIPTPSYRLIAATPFAPIYAAPERFALVPNKLDYWGNNKYGDCVSAEEAFAKACYLPEIFIPAEVVISWARKNGVLNGAMLDDVMDKMARSGFIVGTQEYRDGSHNPVDYSNESVLQAALATGPVKLGMGSRALPREAGNQQGWYAVGDHGGRGSEDHCTALCGYGPAGWLYKQLGVPLPSQLQAEQPGYLHFTWSTIGFVDHAWIMGAVGEAHIRSPTTLGIPPLPAPTFPVDYYI